MKDDETLIIAALDSLFPDEELIVNDWDTHWPHLVAYIKAKNDEAYNKGFSNGYDTGLRDATTEPAPYKENS